MENHWQASAEAWIADMGEHGDFGRRYVLDPVMLARALAPSPRTALDVGCGEGRFCRMLGEQGVAVTGIDPTPTLIAAAQERHLAGGSYIQAGAERLPFRTEVFDLVVSYLTLIDIDNIQVAIPEMARVLKPGGTLLVANLTSFNTASTSAGGGWVKDKNGVRLHFPIDDYLEERSMWVEYRGIRIINHHRPLSTYMQAFLNEGLQLTYFDEPKPTASASPSRARSYCRAPWFLVMEWRKPLDP